MDGERSRNHRSSLAAGSRNPSTGLWLSPSLAWTTSLASRGICLVFSVRPPVSHLTTTFTPTSLPLKNPPGIQNLSPVLAWSSIVALILPSNSEPHSPISAPVPSRPNGYPFDFFSHAPLRPIKQIASPLTDLFFLSTLRFCNLGKLLSNWVPPVSPNMGLGRSNRCSLVRWLSLVAFCGEEGGTGRSL
jgi:hypothetical protein